MSCSPRLLGTDFQVRRPLEHPDRSQKQTTICRGSPLKLGDSSATAVCIGNIPQIFLQPLALNLWITTRNSCDHKCPLFLWIIPSISPKKNCLPEYQDSIVLPRLTGNKTGTVFYDIMNIRQSRFLRSYARPVIRRPGRAERRSAKQPQAEWTAFWASRRRIHAGGRGKGFPFKRSRRWRTKAVYDWTKFGEEAARRSQENAWPHTLGHAPDRPPRQTGHRIYIEDRFRASETELYLALLVVARRRASGSSAFPPRAAWNIEEVAESTPEKSQLFPVDARRGLPALPTASRLLSALGLEASRSTVVSYPDGQLSSIRRKRHGDLEIQRR